MLEFAAAALLAASGAPAPAPTGGDAAAAVARSLDDDLLQRYAAFLNDSFGEGPRVMHLDRRPGTPPIGRADLLAKHRLTEAQVDGLETITDAYYTERALASTALGFTDVLGSAALGPASPGLQAAARKLQATIDRYLGFLRKDLAKRYGARVPVLLDAHWSEFWFYYVNRPAPAFRIRATDAGLRVARSLTDDLLSRYAAFAIETEPEAAREHRELTVRVAEGEDPSTVGDQIWKRLQPLVDAALRRHGLVFDQILGLQEVTAAYYEELHDRRKGHSLSEVERSFVGAYGEVTLALLKKHWTEFQPYYEAMDRDARETMDATRAAIRAAPVAP